jgi:hypothetical protein
LSSRNNFGASICETMSKRTKKKLWVEVKTHGYNKSQIFSKIDQKAPLELKVNPFVFWLKLQANPHGYYLSKFDQGQKYFLLFRFSSHRDIYIYIYIYIYGSPIDYNKSISSIMCKHLMQRLWWTALILYNFNLSSK